MSVYRHSVYRRSVYRHSVYRAFGGHGAYWEWGSPPMPQDESFKVEGTARHVLHAQRVPSSADELALLAQLLKPFTEVLRAGLRGVGF